jgi:hypothetical protein
VKQCKIVGGETMAQMKELAEAGMCKDTVQEAVRTALPLRPVSSNEPFKVQVPVNGFYAE